MLIKLKPAGQETFYVQGSVSFKDGAAEIVFPWRTDVHGELGRDTEVSINTKIMFGALTQDEFEEALRLATVKGTGFADLTREGVEAVRASIRARANPPRSTP
jgi:hypothetical protein